MSYILEALKKTDQEDTNNPASAIDNVSPPQIGYPPVVPSTGMSLTWKIVLGLFALANLGLLGLVYSSMGGESDGTSVAVDNTRSQSNPGVTNLESNQAGTGAGLVPPQGTRPLPGIVSPKLTPPPAPNSTAANSGSTPQVYRPSSASSTSPEDDGEVGAFGTASSDPDTRAAAERKALAEALAARDRALGNTAATNPAVAPVTPSTAPSIPEPTTLGPALLPETSTVPASAQAPTNTVATPATATKQLRQLTPEARARLQNLNFSTHIYGTDADLRAVVVNGIRVVEGQSQGGFLLRNILEDGVVIEFEHAGAIERVMIPVLEDWKG